jgi:parallel beta-helix repeat protein
MLLLATAVLVTFSTSSAWAEDCGDGVGPCKCGDIVIADTTLTASDPVVNGVCSPVGLFVAAGVRLDAHLLNMECGPPPPPPGSITIGIWVIGDSVEIVRGIIRGCGLGVFGRTSHSLIQRVTAHESVVPLPIVFASGIGIFFIGADNTLLHNLCHNNPEAGIVVIGDRNTLERNYCAKNGQDGIGVNGSFNQLNHNIGARNGGHGVFVIGGDNLTDGRNYGSHNVRKPDCSIDGQSITPDGIYC